jgi:hypothetical protein
LRVGELPERVFGGFQNGFLGGYRSQPVIANDGSAEYGPLIPPFSAPLGSLPVAGRPPGYGQPGNVGNLMLNFQAGSLRGGLRLPIVYGPHGVLFGPTDGGDHGGPSAGRTFALNPSGSPALPRVFTPTASAAPGRPALAERPASRIARPFHATLIGGGRPLFGFGRSPNGFGHRTIYVSGPTGGAHGHSGYGGGGGHGGGGH